MPPYQRAQRSHSHYAPDEHRQPSVGDVDEHNLNGRALLIIVRRQCGEIEPGRQQQDGRSHQPWQHVRHNRKKPCWISEIDQCHGMCAGLTELRILNV